MVLMSARWGKLPRMSGSSVNRLAAISGRAAGTGTPVTPTKSISASAAAVTEVSFSTIESTSVKSAVPVKQTLRSPSTVFRPEMSLAGGPYLGGGPSDADVVPLVRVNPRYPPRANARGIEGWVWLEFTITPQGTTKDIVVLDADPKGYFERAAKNAVKKYKYKPRVENGVPVERPGVQVVISFDLED